MIVSDLPFTWIGIRSTGISAWVLLTAVVAIGLLLRTRLLGGAVAPQGLLLFHRYIAVLSMIFLSVHMGLLVLDPVVKFTIPQLVIPFLAPWNPTEVALGITAFWLLVPVLILGVARTKLGKKGNLWFKRAHIAAYFAWPLATLHFVLAGTDALTWWALAVLIFGSGVIVFLLLSRGFVPRPTRSAKTKITTTPTKYARGVRSRALAKNEYQAVVRTGFRVNDFHRYVHQGGNCASLVYIHPESSRAIYPPLDDSQHGSRNDQR